MNRTDLLYGDYKPVERRKHSSFDHLASPEKAPSLLLCSIMRELVFNFFKEIAFLNGFELPGRVETQQV
jgi:hypothetical protein